MAWTYKTITTFAENLAPGAQGGIPQPEVLAKSAEMVSRGVASEPTVEWINNPNGIGAIGVKFTRMYTDLASATEWKTWADDRMQNNSMSYSCVIEAV